ncbi:MAG: MBL fold metallo-hydrolase [Bauldia sp.]|nr:MBL fold metallo-hydrolase [Bauldia sp.]
MLPTAVAGEWYERIAFGEGVTLIHEPFMPFFFRCNIWHVRGRDRNLLIDTGSGALSLTRYMPWLLERPTVCILSHTHWDHIGSAHEFPERLVHRAEAAILADPTNEATLASKYATDDENVEARMFTRRPPGWVGSAYRIVPAPATGLVADGDEIDLGDRRLSVLHTPGHSPGHLSLFEEKTGILFSADAVYDGPLVDTLYHSDTSRYRATMRRLRELQPSIVHGGHFPSFGLARFREIIAAYLAVSPAAVLRA